MGVGVYESFVSYNTYKQISLHSDNLLQMLNDKDFNQEEAVSEYEKMEEKWNEYKDFALVFSNHVSIKDYTQKMNTVRGYLVKNNLEESYVAILMLKASTEFLLRENLPSLENIL